MDDTAPWREPYWTISEWMRLTGMSAGSVYGYLRKGTLRFYYAGPGQARILTPPDEFLARPVPYQRLIKRRQRERPE